MEAYSNFEEVQIARAKLIEEERKKKISQDNSERDDLDLLGLGLL